MRADRLGWAEWREKSWENIGRTDRVFGIEEKNGIWSQIEQKIRIWGFGQKIGPAHWCSDRRVQYPFQYTIVQSQCQQSNSTILGFFKNKVLYKLPIDFFLKLWYNGISGPHASQGPAQLYHLSSHLSIVKLHKNFIRFLVKKKGGRNQPPFFINLLLHKNFYKRLLRQKKFQFL